MLKTFTADENADFFEQMKSGQYYAGSAANLAMHEQLSRSALSPNPSTYNDNRVTNNMIKGGDSVSNKSEDATVVFGGGDSSTSRPGMSSNYNTPGNVM